MPNNFQHFKYLSNIFFSHLPWWSRGSVPSPLSEGLWFKSPVNFHGSWHITLIKIAKYSKTTFAYRSTFYLFYDTIIPLKRFSLSQNILSPSRAQHSLSLWQNLKTILSPSRAQDSLSLSGWNWKVPPEHGACCLSLAEPENYSKSLQSAALAVSLWQNLKTILSPSRARHSLSPASLQKIFLRIHICTRP